MTDLFRNKKEQVYDFIKSKGRCSTHQVIEFGLSIFHTRAERDARNLASENKIWRVKDSIKDCIAHKSKESYWSIYEADK